MVIIGKLLAGISGVFFNLIGVMMLVFEIMVWVPDPARANQVLGRVWFEHDPFFFLLNSHSIQLAQVVAERKLKIPALWNPGVTTILNWPSWVALLVLGIAGLLIGGVLMGLARGRARAA
ncbi:MAG TPA: hypothetical protein ENJ68_06060 [Devosia sp.]|nr:hypothetical protein [Devosia sp.]